ncbi:hypothetical protein JG688_00016944 [Phytophthora aleatoria]|uniref:Uncharacterized protein n=1 Tax=Phytophthora aleatoria TaxID=2496075 RepID=A0A8J5ITB6_9STRA|nr:hypothetical protein JG688_00016944 [Phytophthora aleatoria]
MLHPTSSALCQSRVRGFPTRKLGEPTKPCWSLRNWECTLLVWKSRDAEHWLAGQHLHLKVRLPFLSKIRSMHSLGLFTVRLWPYLLW